MIRLALVALCASAAAAQGARDLKPGWNLFSKDQDIQLGKEAAAQVEKESTVIRDGDLAAYVRRIGTKLAATVESAGYPYTFQVVADQSVNAFALPGGPAFVHTGLFAAADNEAQVAGVLAHEISHVALRHGTSQASKANLLQLPLLLAGGFLGQGGSLLGQLSRIGIGIGANSVLLRFSRTAETEADLLGTRILAKAGYDPLEMARFFEKLEASGGARVPQILSDHPNPGNRVKAVEEEIRYLPQARYTKGSQADFVRAQKLAAAVAVPATKKTVGPPGGAPASPRFPVSGTLREYVGRGYRISHPENWEATASRDSNEVQIVPREGSVRSTGGAVSIGAGAVIDFAPSAGDLRRDTEDLVKQLIGGNPGMRIAEAPKGTQVGGQRALITILESPSPFASETERDCLVTVSRPEGLFFAVLIAPRSAVRDLERTFDQMLRSIRF